jgi:hypothetical protein
MQMLTSTDVCYVAEAGRAREAEATGGGGGIVGGGGGRGIVERAGAGFSVTQEMEAEVKKAREARKVDQARLIKEGPTLLAQGLLN